MIYQRSHISELWMEDKSAVTWGEWRLLPPASSLQPPALSNIDRTHVRKLPREKLITNVKTRRENGYLMTVTFLQYVEDSSIYRGWENQCEDNQHVRSFEKLAVS